MMEDKKFIIGQVLILLVLALVSLIIFLSSGTLMVKPFFFVFILNLIAAFIIFKKHSGHGRR